MKPFFLFILSILCLAIWSCSEDPEPFCDNSLTTNLKAFADENWSLENWVFNRFSPPIDESMDWNNFSELTTLSGTRDLALVVSGDLAAELNTTLISSDSLETHPEWFYSGDVSILRDSIFYVNIAEYNQFMGGWNDARNSWYWEQVDSSISSESKLSTPLKDNYITIFPDCD